MDDILKTLQQELKKLEETLSKEKSERNLLELVVIKGDGYGFYWSPQKKEFVRVNRKSELYLYPNSDCPEGKKYIFMPVDKSGVIVEVDEEDIQLIGFN